MCSSVAFYFSSIFCFIPCSTYTKCTLFSYCRLGEYLEMYVDGYPDADKIPEDVCVKHVIYAWQLALEARERDQGRRRSMMS